MIFSFIHICLQHKTRLASSSWRTVFSIDCHPLNSKLIMTDLKNLMSWKLHCCLSWLITNDFNFVIRICCEEQTWVHPSSRQKEGERNGQVNRLYLMQQVTCISWPTEIPSKFFRIAIENSVISCSQRHDFWGVRAMSAACFWRIQKVWGGLYFV